MDERTELLFEMQDRLDEMSSLWDEFKEMAEDVGVSEYVRRTTMANVDMAFGVGGWLSKEQSLFDVVQALRDNPDQE